MTESHFLYFFLHFNEPISFAIVILDGLYLWVWESSIVKAVENACIVEESQVSCTHKKHLLTTKRCISLLRKLKSIILTAFLTSCEPKTVLYTSNSLLKNNEPKTFVPNYKKVWA